MVREEGPLHALWKEAAKAVIDADAIAFIGYRFPPTDALSREKLMGWIRTNVQNRARRGLGARLRVHTVLGDNVNSSHSRRLVGLLEAVGGQDGAGQPRIEVRSWPMFAEDFLGLVQRVRL